MTDCYFHILSSHIFLQPYSPAPSLPLKWPIIPSTIKGGFVVISLWLKVLNYYFFSSTSFSFQHCLAVQDETLFSLILRAPYIFLVAHFMGTILPEKKYNGYNSLRPSSS